MLGFYLRLFNSFLFGVNSGVHVTSSWASQLGAVTLNSSGWQPSEAHTEFLNHISIADPFVRRRMTVRN